MFSGLWDLFIQCLCVYVGILSCLLECGYHLTGCVNTRLGKKGEFYFRHSLKQSCLNSETLKQDCRSGTKDKHSIRSKRLPEIRMNTAS